MNSVVVVGAGPAGLMLACELALHAVDTVVVDLHATQRLEAPAMAINAGTIDLLDQRGLADQLRKGTVIYPNLFFASLPLDTSKSRGSREPTHMVLQARLEKTLVERATELGVEFRRATTVTGVEQDDGGVTVRLSSATGDEQVRCAYVVGCDGRDSVVRISAGIDFIGTDWVTVRGIVGDVEIAQQDVLPAQIGLSYTPNGDQFLGAPLYPGTMRVFTAEFATGPPEHPDGPATVDQLRAAVSRLTGTELKATGSRWLSHYHIVTRNAERYRHGRVFIAGDAAHVHYPYNGQGIATALGDAVNLGWKLAAAVHGWAPDGLLGTYHAERHPAGELACASIQTQLALLHPQSMAGYLRQMFSELLTLDEVNAYLVELVTNVGTRYPMEYPGVQALRDPDGLLGRRIPKASIKTADGETSIASTLHRGHAVLLDLSGGTADLAGIRGWADRVDVVHGQPNSDIAASVLLLRPDGHVAWLGSADTSGEGLPVALRTWFGTPATA